MSAVHLSGEELDLVLSGEGIAPERAAHLGSCQSCRRRREELEAAIAGAALPEPGEIARARVRRAALAALSRRTARAARWLAAAAALVLAVLAAVLLAPALRPAPVDTEAVLREVDEVLSRDPLTAFADQDVVEVVVADAAAEAPPPSS